MTCTLLLEQLRQRDIRLSQRGDRLVVDAPRGVLTKHLRETLRRHKAGLLTILGTPPGVERITPAELPSDWRIEWEERAAIREFDGGQAREHAEAEALTEILARMRAAERCT